MPLMRRRPLLRAAVVGGTAYAAGKRTERRSAHEYEQDQQLADMQAGAGAPAAPAYAPPPPPPPAPAPTSAADRVSALTDLKGLLDAGVLTQAEFDAQKQKILQEG